MQIKIKSLLFALSLFFNVVFILLMIVSASSKTSSFSFFKPDDYITAASLVSVPKSGTASVELIEINIKPREKAYLQFSVISGQNKQGNMLFNPLHDPNIISVSQTGFGLEITALCEGSTLIQTFTNEGIKNVALINICP
jgi:hypothetical protein